MIFTSADRLNRNKWFRFNYPTKLIKRFAINFLLFFYDNSEVPSGIIVPSLHNVIRVQTSEIENRLE